jgi:glycosyltransferase involved in cell wall biosynthesis/2-polyprenyl-3-methyl-5-hydroxy-6-metoxy-1,4-benzoquinol methylase
MSAGEESPRSLGWEMANLRQDREQELHDDRIGRLYLGLEGDEESRRRAVARIEWMLTACTPGRMLDIGCSEGILCILASKRGHEAEGWDINPTSIEAAENFAAQMLDKTDVAPKFAVKDVFSATELAPRFDNVVLGEVIEHVYEPEAMIRRAVLALRDGGRLIITTPWGHFPAPDHHQTFTLTRFLSTLPEVVEWDHVDVIDGYIRFAGTRALTPGSDRTAGLSKRNSDRFPSSRLLEISERAAIESQRFLRTTLTNRYAMWQTARDAAEKHHATAQEAARESSRLRAEVERLSAEVAVLTSEASDRRTETARLESEIARLTEETASAASSAEQLRTLEREAVRLRGQLDEARETARATETRLDHALALSTRRARQEHWRARSSDPDDPGQRWLRRTGWLLRRTAANQPALRRVLLRRLPDPWILKLDRATRFTTQVNNRGSAGAVLSTSRPRPHSRTVPSSTSSTSKTIDVVPRLDVPEAYDLHLVCGAYPDGTNQYGGEFLRARVNCYRARGLRTLVLSVHQRHTAVELLQLEEADLLQVPPDRLGRLITSFGKSRSVPTAVHAPTPEVGRFFLRRAAESPTVFFLHGAEARDYRRLHFNFTTEQMEMQRERLDRANVERADFLREASASRDARLVFVSDYLRRVAEADFELHLADAPVVHNVIDGEFFKYRRREPGDRRRLLLVRNFQQYNYGNDIALRALEMLLGEPDLADVTVTIRGFGEYFGPLTRRLQSLPNVDASEGYVESRDLRRLHDEHGVFLVPTRHDTQGVSMGEAMASGLVCVTNRIAAIPEFVSDAEAVLVEGESPRVYAAALRGLLADPDGFVQRSAAAAARVREQCGVAATVDRELELLGVKVRS